MTQRGLGCLCALGGDDWLPSLALPVTSVRSPCSLQLPRPQNLSFQRSPMSHAGKSLGREGGARRQMSVLASFTGKREAEKWHMGKGGRELQGQAALQLPCKRCLLLCPQRLAEGGKGDKGKPDARENGFAMIQQQRRSIFSPEKTRPGGAGGAGQPGGRAEPGGMSRACHAARHAGSAMLQMEETPRTHSRHDDTYTVRN